MIFNYIKIAWRNLVKQRLFSLINITGLAVGLAVCMMIMMYVVHEMSYDRFHKNAPNIYTIRQRIQYGNLFINPSGFSYVTGPVEKQTDASVEDYIRIYKPYDDVLIKHPSAGNTKFHEAGMMFTDTGFFNFFSFRLISGNAANVLSKPFSVVISQKAAAKYFGSKNPIGKMLRIKTDSTYNYQVTGIAENTASNSSIQFDFVASNESLKYMKEESTFFKSQDVGEGEFKTYFALKPGSDTAKFLHGLQLAINETHQKTKETQKATAVLTRLTDVHLRSGIGDSNLKYLKVFPVVAALILLLALVNYMSLSTAKATLRAKEIGVRKISGASRKGLILQFYIESALYSVVAFSLAGVLSFNIAPWFINRLELNIDTAFLYSSPVLISLSILFAFTVLIAGTYPSLVLSSLKPAVTLKGKGDKTSGGYMVRKTFTTLQFTIAISLIICSIIINRQLNFFRNADTGLDKENVLVVRIAPDFGGNYRPFKKDVESLAGVSQTATSHYKMYDEGHYDIDIVDGVNTGDKVALSAISVDENFVPTLGIKWENKPESVSEVLAHSKIIINETAAVKLGIAENPIGQTINSGPEKLIVGGVVKDFNYDSMETAVKPLCLSLIPASTDGWYGAGGYLFVKIKPHTNTPSILNKIQEYYNKYKAETSFSYTFMDDAFNRQYKAEDRLASIFNVFTYITIMLATLGLFGLAAFTIEQRTKEIGIRKVLGASLTSINTLLSRDFLALVILSIVIASPIAWWAMHKWLQGFAYRINVQWWMFAVAGVLAIVTAIITVSYHAIRAGIANPVESLRSE